MEKYVPSSYKKTIFDIDYEKLYNNGIRVLLFDMDNTLAPACTLEIDTKLYELITLLNNDFKVIIVSNSGSKRVKRVANSLRVDYVASANKPTHKGYKKVKNEYNCTNNEMVIIGDQLLTDVASGNTFGIMTILVDPVGKDRWVTYMNRFLENRKLKKLTKEKKLERGIYYG